MEKESNSQYYLPFPPARLVPTKKFIKEIIEPAGGYGSGIKPNRFLTKFISELNDFSEDLFAETNVFEQESFYLPPKWKIIAEYLKEEGIIKNAIFEPLFNDEPKFFRFIIIHNLDSSATDGSKLKQNSFAHGDSVDIEEAIAKAFGELLERYFLTIYREKELTKFSLSEIKKKKITHLSIDNISGFSDKQKEKVIGLKFDERSPFYWTEGKNLLTEEKTLLPAQLVFWSYNLYHKNWREPILRERNTNGAGGHCTLTKSILSGIYELIQRDGFLVYWLNRQPPPQIDPRSIKDKKTLSLIEQCDQMGLEVTFFNTTSDIGVPACICVVTDVYDNGSKISMGGDCGPDWENIIRRSLTEALSVYHWQYGNQQDKQDICKYFFIDDKDIKPFNDANLGQQERLSFWANEKNFKHFEFFLKGDMQSLEYLKRQFPEFNSSEDELKYLMNKFKKMGAGYEIYYFQAKNKVLDKIGYYSVKVIIPQMINLYLNEINAPLGAERLRTVPEKLGFKPAHEFCPWPHPFP